MLFLNYPPQTEKKVFITGRFRTFMKIDDIQDRETEVNVVIALQKDNIMITLQYQKDKEEKKLVLIPGYVKGGRGDPELLTDSDYEEAKNMAKEALLSDPRFSGYTLSD